MPAITTNDLKNGITLELDNGLFQVVEFQHVKPGKGGAFVRTKLRNVKTGNVFDRTFNAGIRVEQAIINREDMQFLYRDGDDYVFMDNDTYDQMHVPPVALGDAADYMVEGMTAQVAFFQGEIISVDIPASVELAIAETEPGVQGDRVSRRPQAGHARDRQGRPGAAVRRHRRPDQGRHPLRRIHHAGLMEPSRRALRRSRAGAVPAVRGALEGDRSADTIDVQVLEPDELTQHLVAASMPIARGSTT